MTTLTFNAFNANTDTIEENTAPAFRTSRVGTYQKSFPTVINQIHYNKTEKTISAMCADGNTRVCRVARLPSLEAGRQLWSELMEAGKAQKEVVFVAAGGFSADRWFFMIEETKGYI